MPYGKRNSTVQAHGSIRPVMHCNANTCWRIRLASDLAAQATSRRGLASIRLSACHTHLVPSRSGDCSAMGDGVIHLISGVWRPVVHVIWDITCAEGCLRKHRQRTHSSGEEGGPLSIEKAAVAFAPMEARCIHHSMGTQHLRRRRPRLARTLPILMRSG